MAQPINPPDGWTVTEGTWGVDFQRDTSVYLTSGTSVKMVGPAAQNQTLVGPWFPIDGNGVAYVVTGVLRATNNTSKLTLKLEVYQGDQTTLVETISLYTYDALPSANTWTTPSQELQTASNKNWARFVLRRNAGETADVYLDRLEVKKLGPRWGLFKNDTGQTLPTDGSAQQIAFNNTEHSSLVTVNGGDGGSVTIYRAGLYLLYFRTRVTNTTGSAGMVYVYFKVDDPYLGAMNQGATQYVVAPSGVVNVVLTSLYRHTGKTTTGSASSNVSVRMGHNIVPGTLTVAGGAEALDVPVNPITAVTATAGVWLGLG